MEWSSCAVNFLSTGKIVQNWGHYGSKKINKIVGRLVLNV